MNGDACICQCGIHCCSTVEIEAKIGGSLAPRFWGTGIAPEALTAIMEFGFGPMDLHAIEAKVNPANRSTIAWLQKFGFKKEAHFKDYGLWNGEYLDLAIYTLFNPDHL
ncbi:MAG: GNAT family N-acetyltransferase [Myxococcales bacterium]|nr:GNAT family N-acetyltransferase [Myxococcales bacterium]